MPDSMTGAVLFDMDGVLLESYEAWFGLLNGAARDLGYPAVDRERYAASWGQGVDADVANIFVRHTVAEVESYYNAHFRAYLPQITMDPEAPPLFLELRGRGFLTAVVTNTPALIAREILQHAGIEPDVLVGGTDTPRPKPAPDPVLHACRSLGVSPARSLFLGDSRFDREAAFAAGVRFVGYRMASPGSIASLSELASLVYGGA